MFLVSISMESLRSAKMYRIEQFCEYLGINISFLSAEERAYLEVDIFMRLCEEVRKYFMEEYSGYFALTDVFLKEINLLDLRFIHFILNQILKTEEYSLNEIAYYTYTPVEIIYEIIMGKNERPPGIFIVKLMELHRVVMRDLYLQIRKKLREEYGLPPEEPAS